MARRKSTGAESDLSSFMSILLMTIGVLIAVLVSNTLIIISNPENVQISSVVSASPYMGDGGEEQEETGRGKRGPPAFGNTVKQPTYIDVYKDRLIVYNSSTNNAKLLPAVIPLSDLEVEDNAFNGLLAKVYPNRDTEYIVLLARPKSASVVRRLRNVIRDRGIDVGHELFEMDRKLGF